MNIAPQMEIRTRSVERALEPLAAHVSSLINGYESTQNTPSHSGGGDAGNDRKSFSYHTSSTNSSPSIKVSKGKSKRAQVLVATVEQAVQNFVTKGEEIARENEDMQDEMLTAVNSVSVAGGALHNSAKEFADKPIASDRRAVMVNDARALLSAVTRLLIVADMIDVNKLMKALRVVENDIESMRNVENHQTLMEQYHQYGSHVEDLGVEAARRQYELMDARMRDDIASARATLNRNKNILLTSSRAYVRHPEVAAAKENRDFVLQQVTDAVSTIHDVARGQAPTATGLSAYDEPGELSAALDEFDERVIMQPHEYHQVHSRDMLERQLESIITGAALVADMSSTRDDRRERIIAECNAVRQALQGLLNEYISSTTGGGGKRKKPPMSSEALEQAIAEMTRRTRDLRRQLRKAIVDHVSDSFLESNVPLIVLIEAARAGDQAEVEAYGAVFEEHARKLVEVAHLACSMSEHEDGVKMVRYAAAQIEALFPQVINAARLLCARPKSKVTLENMDAFRLAWENQVRILTDAVDDITTLDDFLAVSESHILEDINKCIVAATQDGDVEVVDRTAGAIRGRCVRMCAVVDAEMDNFEHGAYTALVADAVKRLRGQILPAFTRQIDYVVQRMSQQKQQPNVLPADDLNDFVGATRMIFEGARELRRAVLLNRSPEEAAAVLAEEDDDLAFAMQRQQRGNVEEYYGDRDELSNSPQRGAVVSSPTHDSIVTTTGTSVATDAENEQHLMRSLPAEERQQIAAQVEVFKIEKTKFDREISKWDDTGNDIIIMAKCMCMIMMEMTDFTRGRGPLKTTGHVIKAAQRISQKGKNLNQLARLIAQQCPESTTKQDLLAYLDKITLFCHQLEITSKVKADVQNIGGEQVVSALEGATSLITAAKNLMNAVVLTVKASFVASTKYSHRPTQQQRPGNSEATTKPKDPPGVLSMTSTMASGVFPPNGGSPTAVSSTTAADPVPVVVWKMRAPDKKPLVKNNNVAEKTDSSSGGGVVAKDADGSRVRRGSLKKSIPPIRELADFVDN